MALITQTIAETHLQAWIDADLAVSKAQSYTIAGRVLTRADAVTIREQIAYWQRMVEQFEARALSAAQPQTLIATATN